MPDQAGLARFGEGAEALGDRGREGTVDAQVHHRSLLRLLPVRGLIDRSQASVQI
jgi:hypothetical protein